MSLKHILDLKLNMMIVLNDFLIPSCMDNMDK